MKQQRLRMGTGRYLRIWIPIISVLLVLIIGITIAMNMFAPVMDRAFGATGAVADVTAETDYYDVLGLQGDKTQAEARAEAKADGQAVSETIARQGSVLLKNNGILPLKSDSIVMPFGYAYLHTAYTGSGAASGNESGAITLEQSLEEYFEIDTAAVLAMQGAEAVAPAALAGTIPVETGGFLGSSNQIYGYPAQIYDAIGGRQNTTAIVFVQRVGGEGSDKKYDGYEDGTPHYLALTQAEKETIAKAKEICGKVVLVVIGAGIMELEPVMHGEFAVDAILWTGTPGTHGLAAVGALLSGDENPSGRTADIWAADFTADPTYVNFGSFVYSNTDLLSDGYFVEYEEGIYVGYRYYETMAAELNDLDNSGEAWYADNVTFPFGYGLSYTEFSQEIISHRIEDGEICVSVRIQNIGDRAGRDVVQLYYSSPYTQFDRENGIEKSAVVLAAFAKTPLIPAGDETTVDLTFSLEDMASYFTAHKNSDGTFGCYLLEAGEYTISLRTDSHTPVEEFICNIEETTCYEGQNMRMSDKVAQAAESEDGTSILPLRPANGETSFVPVCNRFSDMQAYMEENGVTNLSRSNMAAKASFPTMPQERKRTASANTVQLINYDFTFDYAADPQLGNTEGSAVYSSMMPVSGLRNTDDAGFITLSEMRGKSYYDGAWNDLLDQLIYNNELNTLLFGVNYNTAPLSSIGKNRTNDLDGVMGLSSALGTANPIDAAAYPSPTMLACSWDVNLAQEFGKAIGNEALLWGINGWYAPGANLHRSPFGGRNYEYYSEDPLLTGKFAAAVIEGAAEKGVYSYLKHFALNDQETNRDDRLTTWATEQTVRELYLRAFEIPVKEARVTIRYDFADGSFAERNIRATTAVMTSQANFGAHISFGNYALMTEILRGEWGFTGMAVTDLYMDTDPALRDLMLRAGTDLYMNGVVVVAEDTSSATARTLMRESVHRIAYTVANSNRMNGIASGNFVADGISIWRIWLIAANVIVYTFIAAVIVLSALRIRDAKKNPQRYRQK